MSGPLEPLAAELFEQGRSDYARLGKPIPPDTMLYIMAMSQATSLKRIADALWGTDGTTGIVELLNGIEAHK